MEEIPMSGVTGGVMETEKSHFNRAIPRAQVLPDREIWFF